MTRRANSPSRNTRRIPPANAATASEVASEPKELPVSRTVVAMVCLALVLVTLAIYGRTLGYGFVAYDDNKYVYENPLLRDGLSWANLAWAWTTFYFANWCPLTWISYMADVQIFGLHAGEMHAINVLLQALTALTLFLALLSMTGRLWRCALVVGLFAVHPLHVETVAWISDRKDVLSAFFAALALLFYAKYARRPSALWYLAVAGAFALSLTAKTMTVSLPFVLLLLDFWPLARLSRRAVLEKLPLLAMAAVAGTLTVLAQQRNAADFGAVTTLQNAPFSIRAANSMVSYVDYIAKAIWPVHLAMFYPPVPHSPASVLGAAAILLAVTAAAVKWVRRRPFFLMGWLWYLGMLLPVIGIVRQVGDFALADRYMYLPLVGLSIAVIWTLAESIEDAPPMRRGAAAGCLLVLATLAVAAGRQTTYWVDSRTLFEHGLAVTQRNSVLANNLGVVLERKDGPSDASAALFREAILFKPEHAPAHANLGLELLKSGHSREAREEFAEAVRLNPRLAMAQTGLGVMFAGEGNYDEAQRHLEEAVRLDRWEPESQNNLCAILLHFGRPEEAEAHCTEAVKVRPDYTKARVNLARAFALEHRKSEAERQLYLALSSDPDNSTARRALLDLRSGQLR